MTIRFRLGMALALALLPVLALGLIQATLEFNRDAQIRETGLIEAAARSASEAQGRLRGAVALLQTLTPQAVGVDCTPRLASALKELHGYRNIARIDANGRVECAGSSVVVEPTRSGRPWFVVLRRGAPVALARARQGSEPTLLAAVRAVKANGQFDGALVATMQLDSLRPDLSDPTLPAGTAIAIVNGAGATLVQTDPMAEVPLPPTWFASTRRTGRMFYVARARDGAQRDVATAPLLNRDAFVVLSAPAPPPMAWGRIHPMSSLVYPLLAWLSAWTAVWFVSERVVIRWLAYLERVAAIYARGRFSVRSVKADRAPLEIRALAQTLDAMADGIVARDISLRESIAHKDALMREIHHRVKNNLQVITSLLNMQQRALTDPAAQVAMSETRQRITALALIYRALYQSPDLKRVDVRQFLEELFGQLTAGDSGRGAKIRTQLDADDLDIDPDKLAPLALFAVEAITIARKREFGTGGGLIRVRFEVGPEEVRLEIVDNGRDDPAASGEGSVGRTLMTAFARQLRGRADVEPMPDGGMTSRLTFPTPRPEPPMAPDHGDELGWNRAAA